MRRAQWLAVGIVRRPHGVKGKLLITPLARDPGLFKALKEILLGNEPLNARPYPVERVQFLRGSVLVKLQGLSFEGAVEARGCLLWARREDLPPLEEGEYYWQDLIGMEVFDHTGQRLGEVKALLETGESQVLVSRGNKGEILIPFVEGIILEVDENEGKIIVDLPEGLWEPWNSTS